MKNWMKFAAILIVGTLVFTSCEKDVVLNVPGDVTIDLGDEFDPLQGVTVDGAKVEDVNVMWNPAWSNVLVNQYVATYQVDGETAQRNVYVRADKLTGTYSVTDTDDGGPTYAAYPVTVTRGPEFNELRFNELFFDDIIVNATIDGSVITIPSQNYSLGRSVNIQGTGTYNGETQKILTINYTINDDGDVITGVSAFN